jgi:hypothetical protein
MSSMATTKLRDPTRCGRFIASQTLDHFRFAAKLAGLSCPPTQFAACSVGRYTTSKIWQNSENGARCSSNGSTGDRDRERSETKPPGECGLIGERASCFSAASSTIRTGAWLKSSRRFFPDSVVDGVQGRQLTIIPITLKTPQ